MKKSASTGPRSVEGKARSSMNALKTGIYSKSLTIPGEDPAQLAALTEQYFARYQPTLPEQRDLVDILVRSTWTLRRLATAEAQIWNYQMDRFTDLSDDAPVGQTFFYCDQTLSRLQRIVNSTQRNFRDALHELRRFQPAPIEMPTPVATAPVTPSKQFVPSTPVPPPEDPAPTPAKTPPPEPQPLPTEPVTPSSQFVSSTPVQPPAPKEPSEVPQPEPLPAGRRRAFGPPVPKGPEKLLPFHLPGVKCYFEPAPPSEWKQCPFCFPPK